MLLGMTENMQKDVFIVKIECLSIDKKKTIIPFLFSW